MEDDGPWLEAMRTSRYVIGSPEYISDVERDLKQRRTGKATDLDVTLPREQADLTTIDRIVAAAYRIDPKDLQYHDRRSGEAKRRRSPWSWPVAIAA